MNVTPHARLKPDRRSRTSRARLLDRIRAEFKEMPCLRLTCGQAQRLFGMRPDVCERVLATLVSEGTLTRGSDARYGVPADLALRAHLYTPADHERTGSKAP